MGSQEKLSSSKPVHGAKKAGDHYFKGDTTSKKEGGRMYFRKQ